jgi:hypothetical protein
MPESVYLHPTQARETLTEECKKESKVLENWIARRFGELPIGLEDFYCSHVLHSPVP